MFAILFFSGFLPTCGSPAKSSVEGPGVAPVVAVVTVQRHALSNKLEIASELLPFQEIEVYAKVAGYIKKLYVDWGTHVKQGDLLAVLEIPELQQQLLQDEASVRRSGQDLERSREETTRAESVYNVAHLTYNRLAEVQKKRPELVAQEEIDVAEGKDLEARAGVSAAKASVAEAEQALVAAQAALDKDKALYAYSNISAPFDGVVTQIYAYTGALLPAGTSNNSSSALCRLSQNNLLRLVIPVPERVTSEVHRGETVAVQITALNKSFTGKISRFSDQINRETRTMHTEVDVPNPDYVLVPGMYATVEIPLNTVQNALTVPIQALQGATADRSSVLVVDNGNRIEIRNVTVGIQTATEAEIVSGLKEDERVLIGEHSQYKAGELVSPKTVVPSQVE